MHFLSNNFYFASDWLVAPADRQASLQLWALFWSYFIFSVRLYCNLMGFTPGAPCEKNTDYSLFCCKLVDGKEHSEVLSLLCREAAGLKPWEKPWECLLRLADSCSQVSTSKAKRKFSEFQGVSELVLWTLGNVKGRMKNQASLKITRSVFPIWIVIAWDWEWASSSALWAKAVRQSAGGLSMGAWANLTAKVFSESRQVR